MVHQRHEGAGVAGRHRRPAVRDGQQDRPAGIIDDQVKAGVGEQLQQALDAQRVLEDHLHPGGGFLDRNQRVDPLTWRASRKGLPLLPVRAGNRFSINDH